MAKLSDITEEDIKLIRDAKPADIARYYRMFSGDGHGINEKKKWSVIELQKIYLETIRRYQEWSGGRESEEDNLPSEMYWYSKKQHREEFMTRLVSNTNLIFEPSEMGEFQHEMYAAIAMCYLKQLDAAGRDTQKLLAVA